MDLKKNGNVPGFLIKTFSLISDPDHKDICGWNEAGDTLIIKQVDQFPVKILPKYFKHSNLPSFIRQLNMYGFHKTSVDSSRHEFRHEYFRRDRKDLLVNIRRKVTVSSTAIVSHQGKDGGKMKEVENAVANLAHQQMIQHREQTDTLLYELRKLRQRSDNMEKRLEKLESENSLIRMDNVNLWTQLTSSKEKQIKMSRKLQRLLTFMYELYLRTSGTKRSTIDVDNSNSSRKEMQSQIAQAFAECKGGAHGAKEFRDTLKYLCMDDTIDSVTNNATKPANGRPAIDYNIDDVADDYTNQYFASSPKRRRIETIDNEDDTLLFPKAAHPSTITEIDEAALVDDSILPDSSTLPDEEFLPDQELIPDEVILPDEEILPGEELIPGEGEEVLADDDVLPSESLDTVLPEDAPSQTPPPAELLSDSRALIIPPYFPNNSAFNNTQAHNPAIQLSHDQQSLDDDQEVNNCINLYI